MNFSPSARSGILCLLAAEPLLEAAFLRPETSRLLVTMLAYLMIVVGLFWVTMPYLLRDQIIGAAEVQDAGDLFPGSALFLAWRFWSAHLSLIERSAASLSSRAAQTARDPATVLIPTVGFESSASPFRGLRYRSPCGADSG